MIKLLKITSLLQASLAATDSCPSTPFFPRAIWHADGEVKINHFTGWEYFCGSVTIPAAMAGISNVSEDSNGVIATKTMAPFTFDIATKTAKTYLNVLDVEANHWQEFLLCRDEYHEKYVTSTPMAIIYDDNSGVFKSDYILLNGAVIDTDTVDN